jgi:hypothetical protein
MKFRLTSFVICATAVAIACGDKDVVENDSTYTIPSDTNTAADLDGDGSPEGIDCDDSDASIYPGRVEDCNGIDDNCNGQADEGFADTDADDIADCVETEDCDGLDNDGDAQVDEGFPDEDLDGVADCVGDERCDHLDNDEDGLIDEGFDVDGDGVSQCDEPVDCDDDDPDTYPGAEEIADDSKDNDCNGMIDETGEGWAAGSLIISEVMNNPGKTTDNKGEWFEVYNNSGADLYLDGLTILSTVDNDTHQIPVDAGLFVPAEGYVVLGKNPVESQNGGVALDYTYGTDITLSNETDNLLIYGQGVLIDGVAWDDGATMPDPDGGSLNLDVWYMSATDNDDPSSWCVSKEEWAEASDAGSPGEPNELCSTIDHDGDGMTGDQGDCDDADSEVYLGAPEITEGVDNDCDGDEEWMPTAVAAYDTASTLVHCDILYLDGTGSSDPDGQAITYGWELISAPTGSAATTADISDATAQNPEFTPDVSGEYQFSLTVNDGGTDSFASTLAVTISDATSNTDPVANAGTDDSSSDSVTCQAWSYGVYYTCDACADVDFELDATSSTDANSAYWMTYSWSATTDGTGSVSFDDTTSSTPTVTLSGASATYGVATTETVTATLTATDCYGGTDTDTVDLAYACTGS